MNNYLSINNLKSGDVLLCRSKSDKDIVSNKIGKVTDSKYCHAAIYIGNNIAAESRAIEGRWLKGEVVKNNIKDIVKRYGHIAVFRQPDAWPSDRIEALDLFINNVVETGAKYNLSGIKNFTNNKEEHNANVYEKLNDFFNNNIQANSPNKDKYFCSELVADCFVATEFLSASAAVLYKSDTYSPGDLGKDPTFGTFVGYITSKKDYVIPDNDDFVNNTTYSEIFGE